MGAGDRQISWGLWAFIGVVGWIVVMLGIGNTTLTLAAPAAGVVFGWLPGALFSLVTSFRPGPRR